MSRAHHHEGDGDGGVGGLLAGGRLDEVGSREHANERALVDDGEGGQLADREDGLHVRVAARQPKVAHLGRS